MYRCVRARMRACVRKKIKIKTLELQPSCQAKRQAKHFTLVYPFPLPSTLARFHLLWEGRWALA